MNQVYTGLAPVIKSSLPNVQKNNKAETTSTPSTFEEYQEILERSCHVVRYLQDITRGGMPKKLQGNQVPLAMAFLSQALHDILLLSRTVEAFAKLTNQWPTIIPPSREELDNDLCEKYCTHPGAACEGRGCSEAYEAFLDDFRNGKFEKSEV